MCLPSKEFQMLKIGQPDCIRRQLDSAWRQDDLAACTATQNRAKTRNILDCGIFFYTLIQRYAARESLEVIVLGSTLMHMPNKSQKSI